MTTILVKKELIIDGETRGNCKAVYGITNGKLYPSVNAAAFDMHTNPQNMTAHLHGRVRKIKGHKFCLLTEIMYHVTEISAAQREISARAVDAENKVAQIANMIAAYKGNKNA